MHHAHTVLRARHVLDRYHAMSGWTERTQLRLLCEFVDYIDRAFEMSQYLDAAVRWEQNQAEVTTDQEVQDAC